MTAKIDQVVPLSRIAAFVNNPDDNPEMLAFEGSISPVELTNICLRIDALIFLVCTRGHGRISIDLQEYDLKADTLVIIHPRNYIAICDQSTDLNFCMLVCSLHVVESILPKLTDLLPVIVYNQNTPVRQLDADKSQWMQNLIRLIKSKLDNKPTKFLTQKLYCILQAALYEIMDLNLAQDDDKDLTMSSRKKELMAKFMLAVIAECTRHRKVEYYADKLCITSKHLSAVVKEMSGQTAGKLIDNYVIMEAKMLLRSTDLTVQEISSRLNFPNQSFFGKYFKHATGVSPTEFRAQL